MKQQNYKVGEIFEPLNKKIIYSQEISIKDLFQMIENNEEFDGLVIDVIDRPFIKYLIKVE